MSSWFTELECRVPGTDYTVMSVHVADYGDNHGSPDEHDGLRLWYEYQESLYSGSWEKSNQSWECGPSTLSVLDGLFRLVNDAVFSRGGWLDFHQEKSDSWYGLAISNTISKYCMCGGMVFCPESTETTFSGEDRDSDAPEFLRAQDHTDMPSCVVRPMNRDDYSDGWFRFMVDGDNNQRTSLKSWDIGTCRLLFTPSTGMFHYEVVSMYRERTVSIIGPFTYDEIMQDLSWEWNNRALDIAGIVETLIIMSGDFHPEVPRQVRIEDARTMFPGYEKTLVTNAPHM